MTDDHWKNAEMIVEDSSAAPLIELIHKHRRLCARRQRQSRRAINPMLPAQRGCYGKQRDGEQASKVSHANRQFDEVTG
jgi:hypothetical protein